jgi:hypothetical protein
MPRNNKGKGKTKEERNAHRLLRCLIEYNKYQLIIIDDFIVVKGTIKILRLKGDNRAKPRRII